MECELCGGDVDVSELIGPVVCPECVEDYLDLARMEMLPGMKEID